MRLDRYIGETAGKYSIRENRNGGRMVDIGHPVDDFFVLKLKDQYSKAALLAYAAASEALDPELAADVRELAKSAGLDNPNCKQPD